jgi:hypothetical protein
MVIKFKQLLLLLYAAAPTHTCVRGAAQKGDLGGAGDLDANALQGLQEVLQAIWARGVGDAVCDTPVAD